MAEFEIGAFTQRLYNLFLESPIFPVSVDPYISPKGYKQSLSSKHKSRLPDIHLKAITRKCIEQSISYGDNIVSYNIGNEQMEANYPHYHILEDAPYIRKAGMGTEKTRGSQAKVEVGKRDYNQVIWNGKTFTREYAKNVRGSRKRTDSVSHWITNSNGEREYINRDSNTYANEHYHYIENILDSGILEKLAAEFGAKLMRKQTTGLEVDLADEWGEEVNTVLDAFNLLGE